MLLTKSFATTCGARRRWRTAASATATASAVAPAAATWLRLLLLQDLFWKFARNDLAPGRDGSFKQSACHLAEQFLMTEAD